MKFIHLCHTLFYLLKNRVGSSQDCFKPPSFCSIAKYHQFYTIFYTVINCQNYIFFRNRFMYIVICVSLAEDPTRYFSNRYSIIFIYIHFSAKVGSSRDISTQIQRRRFSQLPSQSQRRSADLSHTSALYAFLGTLRKGMRKISRSIAVALCRSLLSRRHRRTLRIPLQQ